MPGLDVVVDKPLAASAAGRPQELTAHAEARGRLLIPFHNRRWDGDFLTLQRLVELGALGEVARFESRFDRWRPEVDAERWRESADPADAGGLLYDLGVHLIDQALVLFGPAAHVYAELDARRAGAQVDDDVFVAITHAGGVRSHLWASMMAGHLAPRMRVMGTAAAFVKQGLDVQEAQLRAGLTPRDAGFGIEEQAAGAALQAGDETQPIETEPGRYQGFYAGVVAALRGGACRSARRTPSPRWRDRRRPHVGGRAPRGHAGERGQLGIRSTGLSTSPEIDAAIASLTSSSSNGVISLS